MPELFFITSPLPYLKWIFDATVRNNSFEFFTLNPNKLTPDETADILANWQFPVWSRGDLLDKLNQIRDVHTPLYRFQSYIKDRYIHVVHRGYTFDSDNKYYIHLNGYTRRKRIFGNTQPGYYNSIYDDDEYILRNSEHNLRYVEEIVNVVCKKNNSGDDDNNNDDDNSASDDDNNDDDNNDSDSDSDDDNNDDSANTSDIDNDNVHISVIGYLEIFTNGGQERVAGKYVADYKLLPECTKSFNIIKATGGHFINMLNPSKFKFRPFKNTLQWRPFIAMYKTIICKAFYTKMSHIYIVDIELAFTYWSIPHGIIDGYSFGIVASLNCGRDYWREFCYDNMSIIKCQNIFGPLNTATPPKDPNGRFLPYYKINFVDDMFIAEHHIAPNVCIPYQPHFIYTSIDCLDEMQDSYDEYNDKISQIINNE